MMKKDDIEKFIALLLENESRSSNLLYNCWRLRLKKDKVINYFFD